MHATMPRTARLDTPGLLHHIMIRGIERRRIFNDDKDRENIIERLSILLPETRTQCYAWSFLSNHAHFLFQSGPHGIAGLMRRLLIRYMPERSLFSGIGPVYSFESLYDTCGGELRSKKRREGSERSRLSPGRLSYFSI